MWYKTNYLLSQSISQKILINILKVLYIIIIDRDIAVFKDN